jgi:hypothetical protein
MPKSKRNGFMVGLLSLGLLAAAALTAGSAQADSAGPYYATPSWDQTLPSATRFIVLSNFASEAVLDRETGLVWERSPQTKVAAWVGARDTCIGKPVGGRRGWRLPSIPELASLIDPSVAAPGPTLPSGHPFLNVQSDVYWSASTVAENSTLAWLVFFNDGSVGGDSKTDGLRAWCVRGGMNAEAY